MCNFHYSLVTFGGWFIDGFLYECWFSIFVTLDDCLDTVECSGHGGQYFFFQSG